ncbi:MAG: hypothetical protein OXG30_00335 [bacterium]|nr:hypothetical protein [bacterium]
MALAQIEQQPELPFLINDADNHFVEPRDLYGNYVDPKWRHKAVTFEADDQGRWIGVFGGRPSRLNQAVALVASDDEAAAEVAARAVPTAGDENQMKAGQSNIHSPGMTLSRLNPYRNLSMDERIELIAYFRDQEESWGNRDLRLALMDSQGIGAALMFPNQVLSLEYEFADDVDGIYANTRAYNRWINEEIGWGYLNRLFLPAYVSLADPDEAAAEIELVLNQGTTVVQIISGHAHGGRHNSRGGRSMADPIYDGFWARINEAEARVVDAVGIEPIVFGSDFPHSEGLPFPVLYATTQLKDMSDADIKTIMCDNLARFLNIEPRLKLTEGVAVLPPLFGRMWRIS